MKKTTLKIIFSLIGLPLSSLSQLTEGQVYNYEVGDVLETVFTTNSMPPVTYYLDTIVDKVINGNFITYTINRKIKYDGPPPYPQYNSTTETLFVNTTATASHTSWMSSCLPFVDTTYLGECNQLVWQRESDADTTCFEPPIWYSYLYEGLGGPYYWGDDPTNPGWWVEHYLLYSNTQQWGECGTLHPWPVGIEELSETDKQPIKVVDMLGREVKFQPNVPLIYIYSDGTTQKVFRID